MPILETVSVIEAAETLGVHRDTIYEAINADRLRAVDCEGKTRVIKIDLATFEKRRPGRPRKSNPTAGASSTLAL